MFKGQQAAGAETTGLDPNPQKPTQIRELMSFFTITMRGSKLLLMWLRRIGIFSKFAIHFYSFFRVSSAFLLKPGK